MLRFRSQWVARPIWTPSHPKGSGRRRSVADHPLHIQGFVHDGSHRQDVGAGKLRDQQHLEELKMAVTGPSAPFIASPDLTEQP